VFLVIHDKEHSVGEARFLILGFSVAYRLLLVVHCDATKTSASSAPVQPPPLKNVPIKQNSKTMADPTALDDMREEYDFSHATRGNPYQHLVKRPITIETADSSHYSVSIKTIELTATVAPNGTLTLQLSADITLGEHRITLLIQE
jgi:hypothetical protein